MLPLVSAAWLRDRLDAKSTGIQPDLRVIDVRWYLTGKRGKDAYESGHLPGAVFVDLDAALASSPSVGPGRHPLPDAATFERAMRAAGVNDTSFVVAYDDAGGSIAARLWWLLRHFGHESAAVLDGGLPAWTSAGGTLTTDIPAAAPGNFVAKPARTDDVVDRDEVKRALARGALVLDARARERYRGDTEPVDARPGHVPGAVSAPWSENLENGVFACTSDLAKKYEALGASGREVIAYCGSGVTACHDLLALELAGIRGAKLYEGSWSDWAKQAELPAAKGDDPGSM